MYDTSPLQEWEPITKEDILGALQKTKERKAVGPDCIFNEHLKQTTSMLVEVRATFMTRQLEKIESKDALQRKRQRRRSIQL
ncbi:hypothetical protein ANN_27893 [Periplaneta americana]|uniref:Uncharacterized protein n=1 Tax=Periplaneta americana TaxID=6978 RepID=A0ABQ8RVF0_PERAM|nr:hypothetical protein ANN_27893 [Periplaneta americana]